MRRERRYAKYKSEDVWSTLYEQQQQLDAVVIDGSVTGNTVALTRRSTGVTYKSVILARSSDWYRYSLNCQDRWKHGIELVVCGTHDSCLPVLVLALDQLRYYEPLSMRIASLEPLSFDERGLVNDAFDRFRTHKYGHNMFIGALMCGRQDAIERLKYLPVPTRLRIEAKLRTLHLRRQGKPIAV